MSKPSESADQLSSSQRMLLALKEARAKLEAVEHSKAEPIAIIGMSCRFPGGANDPETFWQLLVEGVDAITEIPSDRWDIDAYYDPDPDKPGKTYTRYGGFVQQVDQFDPHFFGISPREATNMDPQQRLLLEVSWEALEHAGQVANRLSGSPTGVFIGITTNDYSRLVTPSGDMTLIDAYYIGGNHLNAAAGRLSYTLGLQGPSIAIDTACSSSLVAIHLACQSLRNEECNQALAGGVNLILSPETSVALSKAHMMAPDGRCKTFDAQADGFGHGEGCGVVVLKRLSDAVAGGDNILALIRGSAVNNDGPSSGFTVPNGLAQQALIRQALANARVEPAQVGYVEAHGTGTSLGDPIEVEALSAVLGEGRSPEQPLRIGSVKTNIGHLAAAAGVAGLIKGVLVLQHEKIPPHLNFKQPNPHIPWGELPVEVAVERRLWPRGKEYRRIAGVSAFGASGTNAHVVLEEAPVPKALPTAVERPLHLLTLSARSEAALEQLGNRYEQYLTAHPSLPLGDICFTANVGRSHFTHRLSVVAASAAEACEKLASFRAGQKPPGVFRGWVSDSNTPKVAFLFTGQGSQYVGMGRQLYDTQSTFHQILDRCDEILGSYLEQPLLSVLYPEAGMHSPLDTTAYTQPALFALEYALASLWQSWGIEPTWVMGHSVGEYVAACVAGVFSLEDGLKLVAERGRLMQALPQEGAMVAVLADEAQVASAIQPHAQDISIAAVNGPQNIVISGRVEAMEAVVAGLAAKGIKTQKLKVSHAFHSPLMEPVLTDFERVAQEVTYSSPRINVISNVTGRLATDELTTPTYWCRHVRQPVRFAGGMTTLSQQRCGIFVEIGPNPTLLGMGLQCVPESGGAWLTSLRSGREDWQQMLRILGELYVRGVEVDWDSVDRGYARRKVCLPTYPFQREHYWVKIKPAAHREPALPPRETKGLHPLLGQRLRQETRFESRLSPSSPPYLDDHRIYGSVVVPGAFHIAMLLSGVKEAFGAESCLLQELLFPQALVLPDQGSRTVRLVMTPQEAGEDFFQIVSLQEGADKNEATSWTLHATGKVSLSWTGLPVTEPEVINVEEIQARCQRVSSEAEFYSHFWEAGGMLGPSFRWMRTIWRGEDEALCRMESPQLPDEVDAYQLYPGLIDSCFQLLLADKAAELSKGDSIYVPFIIARFTFCNRPRPGSQLWCHAQTRKYEGPNTQSLSGDIRLFDETGRIIAEVTGFEARKAKREMLLSDLHKDLSDWLYEVVWQPQAHEYDPELVPAGEPNTWLIFAERGGVSDRLVKLLRERGERCVLVFVGQRYDHVAAEQYQVNPVEPGDFQRLFHEALGEIHPHCCGIVHLWSLVGTPMQKATVSSIQETQVLSCGSVLHLVQALEQTGGTTLPRLWLVTRGAQPVGTVSVPLAVAQAPVWGLGRVISQEHPDLKCVCLDLDPLGEADEVQSLFEAVWSPDREDQVAWRQGVRHVARLVRRTSQAHQSQSQLQIPSTGACRLKISSDGVLDHLTLTPMTRRQPGPGEVEIRVHTAGLNFRDVLRALGMFKAHEERLGLAFNTDTPCGFECAGTIVAVGEDVTNLKVGDEVIAALAMGSIGSFVTVKAAFVVPKPATLRFEEAATLPVAFLTAYYGFHQLANIRPGNRVMIHSAAGGVGLAAVQLAQRAGAEIFATASPRKWAFLRSLGVKHVMNSRTLDFAEEVLAITEGQGVDIVLNSLNGDFIPKSLSVLKRGGRFVEVGKIGTWTAAQVAQLRSDVSYLPFDLIEDVAQPNPGFIASMLSELTKGLQDGTLKPLPYKVFPIQKVISAFRYMAQAEHIGKVVISQPEMAMGVASQPPGPVRRDSSYLITGGLGALGLKVAHWLVEQGARHLVLVGRRSAAGAASEAVHELEKAGAQIVVVQADVSQEEEVTHVLTDIDQSMPPLRGIIHAAGLLDDGTLLRQEWERFARVMAPKVTGAWNLHTLTLDKPLDFFVLFSSVASLLGSPGQGNYSAANAFLDALAHYRRAQGRPALSINWGGWSEVGLAAAQANRGERMKFRGIGSITPKQGVEALGRLLEQDLIQVGVMPFNVRQWCQFYPASAESSLLARLVQKKVSVSRSRRQDSRMRDTLLAAESGQQRAMLESYLREQVAQVLQLAASRVDPQALLQTLGLDSLMGVELSNRLEIGLGLIPSATLVSEYPTITALTSHLAHMMGIPLDSSEESPPESQEDNTQ